MKASPVQFVVANQYCQIVAFRMRDMVRKGDLNVGDLPDIAFRATTGKNDAPAWYGLQLKPLAIGQPDQVTDAMRISIGRDLQGLLASQRLEMKSNHVEIVDKAIGELMRKSRSSLSGGESPVLRLFGEHGIHLRAPAEMNSYYAQRGFFAVDVTVGTTTMTGVIYHPSTDITECISVETAQTYFDKLFCEEFGFLGVQPGQVNIVCVHGRKAKQPDPEKA